MTGDEMQRAIDFLLKNQANFETHFEETNRQWQTRFELQTEETNRQIAHTNQLIAHTNQVVEALAETQTEFTQTVLGFITSQHALNNSFLEAIGSILKELDELAQAQKRTEQSILELTRTVNNFINFSSGNGNSPRE